MSLFERLLGYLPDVNGIYAYFFPRATVQSGVTVIFTIIL